MADNLGPIPIPDPPLIPDFPLRADFGSGVTIDPPIAIHSFDQPGLKTEQRFRLGSGARRFRIRRDHLSCDEYDQLKAHWSQAQGTYASFNYMHYSPLGRSLIRVRYENPLIDFDHLVGMLTGDPGVMLVEVPVNTPVYGSVRTLNRFPDDAFNTALTAQVQTIIPLVAIQDRANATGPMYLSNQRFLLDGQLYLPRLVGWDGIAQSMGEASDSARFTFGNADDVFTKLVNQIDLHRAAIQFALYHLDSEVLVKLWSGYALPWSFDSDGHFELGASDGVFELGLAYPSRMVTRTCWKVYKGRFCPSTSPLPDCPKSWEACNERGVPKSFGGVVIPAQAVQIRDNSTGVHGWGRSWMTSVSIVKDTIYQRAVQEIYTDKDMVVSCDVAEGRDESDFYSALGIVGEGPIGGYSIDLLKHRLDNQPPHQPGPINGGGGWRPIKGTDPAATSDFVGISESPWNNVPYGSTYAAGLAMAEIRRTDAKGLQLSQIADRAMTVTVTSGIGGWTWTAPGARVWTPALSNCVWVAVNVYLRAIGLRADEANGSAISPALMESFFDCPQAVAMATEICDKEVDKLIGEGKERQFPFRGILKERKPLKDWLQEILNCCLGYYTFVNGKLWIGIRENSGVLPGNSFARENILFKSLQATPIQPRFNSLTVQFGDEEFDWQLNNVTVYDIDQASFVGTPESPQYNSSTMNLVGVSNKSQAARIATTRLREEIGGVVIKSGTTVTDNQQLKARALRYRTTILALRTMVGDVISLNHSTLPDGRAEGRVQSWRLNPDFSIEIDAVPSTDSMYDLTFGPKPDDAPAPTPIPEKLPSINGLTWMPNEVGPITDASSNSLDPLYPDALQRTFGLWQDYTITREGVWDAALFVAGEMPINQMAPGKQPRLLTIKLIAGGTFSGPNTVYLAITQRMASMQPLAPSNLVGIFIPEGVTGRQIQITVEASPDSDQPWDLWAGYDRRTIAWQSSGLNVQPTVNFPGPIHQMTKGMPEPAARKIAIAAKKIEHSGIAGVLVTGIVAPNKIQSNDFIGSLDNWVGRIVSALADQSDGSAPLWNFTVTDFDSATGTLTVSPDCVRAKPEDSVDAGDVLIVRSIATSATASTVRDTMWNNFVAQNQFGSPGLEPGKEKGNIARILYGLGAGQYRYITGNTADTINVRPDWDVVPDSSSIVIVEAPDWIYQTRTSDLNVTLEGARVEIRMRVENLRDHVALVAGFLIDDQGNPSDETVAPMREIYVFGQPPTVRVIGPGALDPDGNPWIALATDHTLRVDTSTSAITVKLMPLYVYQGRPLLIVNDPEGANPCTVEAADGETLFDGQTEAIIPPGMTMRFTAG